jgi:hypothetical protein
MSNSGEAGVSKSPRGQSRGKQARAAHNTRVLQSDPVMSAGQPRDGYSRDHPSLDTPQPKTIGHFHSTNFINEIAGHFLIENSSTNTALSA